MTEDILPKLAAIVVLGVGAQWLAWRLRLPSILLLLVAGFVAGPATGLLDPDDMFGSLLVPAVSLAVGLILFEGGLSLRLTDLRGVRGVVRNLVTVGALATWAIAALSAHVIIGLDLRVAVLLGSILVVTGPTVIGPLLDLVRPMGQTGPILRWEGIVIDPIGAMLAVLVFEGISGGGVREVAGEAALGVVKTIGVGAFIGVGAGAALALCLRHYWIPDGLNNPVTLAAVIAAVTASNVLQEESGLLTAVVMGMMLSNQRTFAVRRIVEFKESLRVLLIGGLFVVLSARLELSTLESVGPKTIAFIAVMILIARPLSVLVSTWGSKLTVQERVFLASVAPRGIVAAAVASIFSLRLGEEQTPDADSLVSVTFFAIVGTIAVYGLASTVVARALGLSRANPQGVLIVGAHPWARRIAAALGENGFATALVDSNWRNVADGRMEGLPVHYGSALSDFEPGEIDLGGLGQLLALTPNDSVNALAAQHFSEVFGRAHLYQVAPRQASEAGREHIAEHLRGRVLWGNELTFSRMQDLFDSGAVLKTTNISEEFDYEDFVALYGDSAVILFVITPRGDLIVPAADASAIPSAGDILVSLVPASAENEGGREATTSSRVTEVT